ncbi:MAG: aliphatic sulfonate ABC transporter substrate-binding protein [Liquorilactobacillus ghanensis]|uniref:aliphatic sulfonate ABC transporter substrate-binding protein n=1 Tax=Liquorilactobacillus TaxID=2767888 RepID=UPI000A9B658B|nr:aliphatic sulfonate ABC transporter substrate-binding protein [Liquorilactobacillus ghanensis]
MTHTLRKTLLFILLFFWILITVYGWFQIREESNPTLKTVTIGFQAGDEFDIAKSRGKFATKMEKKGYKVKFKEFQNGAAMMQALATGNIDYARVGDTPPVSALAAGTKLTYVAAGGTKEKGSGIVVKKNSGINSMADLKGKRVAYTKGTSSQYMVLRALKTAGLGINDIKWVNLDQDAAAVAYSKNKVDAWANWDPTVAQVEITENSKLLVNGQQAGAVNRSFIVSPSKFAKNHQSLSKLVIKYGEQDMHWANTHHKQVIKLMTKELKLSKKVVTLEIERRTFGIYKMNDKYVKEEQEIADMFYQSGVLNKQATVAKHVDYLK